MRSVCDLLRPVYEATEGRDGRGSLEVDPRLAHDTDAPWPRRHDRRFGRRPLLLMGPVGMAVTPGTLAVIFGTAPLDAEGQPRLSPAAGPVALVVAKLYVFAVGMSWGPVVWVRLGEKFPNRIRAAALGAAEAAPWIANWLIPTTFPARSDIGLGLLAYGIYTASAILLFFFVVRFVSEAMGKEVEEMRV